MVWGNSGYPIDFQLWSHAALPHAPADSLQTSTPKTAISSPSIVQASIGTVLFWRVSAASQTLLHYDYHNSPPCTKQKPAYCLGARGAGDRLRDHNLSAQSSYAPRATRADRSPSPGQVTRGDGRVSDSSRIRCPAQATYFEILQDQLFGRSTFFAVA